MKKTKYGLLSKFDAVRIAHQVCDLLGHGTNKAAVQLLIETAQAETQLGEYPDKYPYMHGIGLCQFDLIGFEDVKQRTSRKTCEAIFDRFGVSIKNVEHRELAYSPLLSLIFCRLFYRLIPEEIPGDLMGRALYWKKYYNTAKGKGSASKYVSKAAQIEVDY